MKNLLAALMILVLLDGICKQVNAQKNDEVYMFSFFQNNGEDGLHLAYSEDGLEWKALNNNQSFLTPQVGEDKLMRDPCIIQGGDGKYHMVWTVSWEERGIGYASSEDLINWSEQKYIPVMHHEPKAENCWAPEIYYAEDTEQYMIYWATTIPGRFPETDTLGDKNWNHRMYYTLTKDFNTFSEAKVLYDHGFNVIDATIHKIDGEYVMFLKDETLKPKPEKNVRIAYSNQLTGNYTPPMPPITIDWVEGPSAIETDRGWIVYFDMYEEKKYGAVLSKNLKEWTDITDEIFFPKGTTHGTVFKVKRNVLNNLLKSENKL